MLSVEELDEVRRQVRQRRSLSWASLEKLVATAQSASRTHHFETVSLPVLWHARLLMGLHGQRRQVKVVAEYFTRTGGSVQPRVVVVTDGKEIIDCPATAVERTF